jgi:hypothetical protein
MQSTYTAFIDESGGHGFDFSQVGTPTHFVITAILVEPTSLQTLEQQFDAIKQQYYPQSELKSSKIGGKDHIRERLLQSVRQLDFTFSASLLISANTHQHRLQYKESFINSYMASFTTTFIALLKT